MSDMCEHSQTTIYTAGSMSFSGGEVSDTLRDVEVCLQCGHDLPIPQEEIRDRFVLIMKLSKTRREWNLLTDRIYDEPDRDNVAEMAKRAGEILHEIAGLEQKIDEIGG